MSETLKSEKKKRKWASVATPGAKKGRKRHHLAKVGPGVDSDDDLITGRDARTLFMHAAGFSWVDIARAEGVSEGAIGQRIRRARAVIAIDEVYLDGVRELIGMIPDGIANLKGFLTGVHPVTGDKMADKNGQNRLRATFKVLETAALIGDRLKPHAMPATGGDTQPDPGGLDDKSDAEIDRMLLEQTLRISESLKAKLKHQASAQPIEADYSVVPVDSDSSDNDKADGGIDSRPPIADI